MNKKILSQFINDNDWCVRVAVVKNKNTAKEILDYYQ